MILIDSPEAAQPITVNGWRSSTGYFFTSEEAARYAGCTHIYCRECENPTRKGWLLCDECCKKADLEKYNNRPRKAWAGVAMLYSETKDQFYSNLDDAENQLEENEVLSDLRLIICEPVYARPLDSDYFQDDLPEDDEVPDDIEDAIDAFNEAIKGIVLSWSPGKYALDAIYYA